MMDGSLWERDDFRVVFVLLECYSHYRLDAGFY